MNANRIGWFHRDHGPLPDATQHGVTSAQPVPARAGSRWRGSRGAGLRGAGLRGAGLRGTGLRATFRTALGLFGAPLAWVGQVALSSVHVRLACQPGVGGSYADAYPALSWMQGAVLAASAGCVLLALLGAGFAWRELWRTSRVPWDGPLSARHVREERAWLIARIGAMVSTMFVIGLASTDLAVLVGSSCVAS